MKKATIFFITAFLAALSAFGQGSGKDFVSQRIADAINSDKFYMKFGVNMTMTEEGESFKVKAVVSAAVKNGAQMSRTEMTGMPSIDASLTANGNIFLLNESAKTYTVQPQDAMDMKVDLGKLTFKRQGVCKLNGKDYHFDEYSAGSGQTIVFYYNSAKVVAIEMDMGEGMRGTMSLISFSAHIPDNMFFCLGNEWKQGGSTAMPSVDVSSLLSGISESQLKEIESFMSEDQKKEIKKMMQLNSPQGNNQQTPEPPRCNTPWIDNTPAVELAAGLNLGEITVTNKQTTQPSSYVYLANFDAAPDAPKAPSFDLDVTNDGVLLALQALKEEIKGMTNEQAAAHIVQYNNAVMTAIEIKCLTGDMIEKAIACCHVYPSAIGLNNIGLCFQYKDDPKTALNYFQQAEKIDDKNVTILLNIAECFFELGDLKAARQYADRSVALEPAYGLAMQLLTAINLKEGNYTLATETLFRCAATYFSDITASQFSSLKMALHNASLLAENGQLDIKKLLDELFSPNNLDLLTAATRAGFDSNGQDIPANQKRFNWPFTNGNIQNAYESLQNKQKAYSELDLQQINRMDELADADNNLSGLYLSMGAGSFGNSAQDIAASANSIAQQYGGQVVSLPDMSIMGNAYQMASAARLMQSDADGLILLDARQYWCLTIWQTYYQILIDWSNGRYANWTSDGTLIGYYPQAYAAMQNKLKEIKKAHEDDSEDHNKESVAITLSFQPCFDNAKTEKESRECKLRVLRALLPVNKKYVRAKESEYVSELDARKAFYTSSVQPVLEEYWLKINAMTGYCDNLNMQEYFLTQAMQDINNQWMEPLGDGYSYGSNVDMMWNMLVVTLEQEIGIEQSIVDQMPSESPDPMQKKDVKLYPYGEKRLPDFAAGVNLPIFGRVSISSNKNEFSVGVENNLTGNSSVYNLTNGTSSVTSSYQSLAQTNPPTSPLLQTAENFILDKTKNYLGEIPVAGNVVKFWPSTDSSTQRMRTYDSAGNITNTQLVHFRNASIGPVSVGQESVRTGNTLRTRSYIGATAGMFDFRLYK